CGWMLYVRFLRSVLPTSSRSFLSEFLPLRRRSTTTLFPYTTLFRSLPHHRRGARLPAALGRRARADRRHGDPRAGRRRARRPHHLPGRRPDRQRRGPAGAALMACTSVKLTPLRRHVAAVLTIALSCAFVAVMLMAGNLVQASLRSQAAQTYDGADLEITQEIDDDAWA